MQYVKDMSPLDSKTLTQLYLLVSSADNFCKQIGPSSGPTKSRAWSGSNLFDTQMVFLKEFFEKVDFEKNQQTTKKHEKLPMMGRVKTSAMVATDKDFVLLCSYFKDKACSEKKC